MSRRCPARPHYLAGHAARVDALVGPERPLADADCVEMAG